MVEQEMSHYDVIVIGGGIAGVSIGFELSRTATVCLLEMESTLAFHTTGRSAATFLETYGGPEIRALTTGSREFLENPPEFFESELMTPRPLLQFAKQGRGAVIEQLHADVLPLVPDAELLGPDEVAALFPVVRPGYVERGMYEPGAMEMDVAGLHQGYVRGLKANKGEIVKSAPVVGLTRGPESWTVDTADGERRSAAAIVDAAGAWGDVVAEMAGAKPVGLTPLRRTIFMVNSPQGAQTKDLPIFGDIDQSFYVKPEGAQFLCSPADETPCPPMDAKADELEIARAIDEINAATTLNARSVTTSWAGLRSFVPDRNFVVGPDSDVPGFHWFLGQGGYGIQTAPAAARVGAALVRGEELPADLVERGLDAAKLAPHRPGMSVSAGH
ncbi:MULTISPECIES: FAD-binding oxidoreductase [unclassified Nocardioides]|uniref:NAD(P)/FAD-dependent oxidoreductase n=1 Tax=unclassified Nocardioides TaxID=2615069 RepID=UPI0002E50150|nr:MULTISPECIES: FAD-binding oxidoreductase [unclassified Nocardioides]